MSEVEPSHGVRCPTPTAHKRLEEVHSFWHKCVDGYQDPEDFRVNLNACIQAARNLTFALQAEKRLIDDFDDWYTPWQAAIKADPIMKWLNEARVQIVHRGDLETNSLAVARLIVDYSDAAREVVDGLGSARPEPRGEADVREEVSAPPLLTLAEILEHVSGLELPDRVYRESTLSIERRWEDSALPGRELTESLAHVYGFLRRVIHDAHDHVGITHGTVADLDGETVRVPEVPENGGRLPCMVTTRSVRTVTFNVKDGRVATAGRRVALRPSAAKARAAQKKYKLERASIGELPSVETILDLTDWYAERAKAIVRSGEEHAWMVFFFRGTVPVDAQALFARDAAEKRALAQELADIVAVNGVDGVVEVGEFWHAPFTVGPDGAHLRPADHPHRGEALAIHIELADGRSKTTSLLIERRRGLRRRVKFLPTHDESGYQNNTLEPVRAVWRARGLREPLAVASGSSFFKRPSSR